ncbi:DUF5719 family protein [Gulosibacter faecalis]|uniref:DUF5719 family protein n=1 Tax=Gulosibacter faecalis TaxID=272240 RepID=A0ABW5UT64_9MICO|nr:DUF5719 family protein [Gulosibacter faecalis]
MPDARNRDRDAFDYRAFGIDPELVGAPALEADDEPLRLDTLNDTPAYLGGARDVIAAEVADAADAEAFGDADRDEPAASELELYAHPADGEDAAGVDDDDAAEAGEDAADAEAEAEPDADETDVPLDPDAPSATASAANASEAASSEQTPESFARGGRGRRRTSSTRPKRRRAARSRAQEHRRRTAASVAARTVGTVAAIAIVGASAWALGWMPLPGYEATAQPVSVTPSPGDQLRVCPGPLQQLGVTSNADEITSVGSPEITSAAIGGDPETTALSGDGDDSTGPSVLALPGSADGRITQLMAAQTLQATGGDASGFAATACMQPTPSQWLLAGDTTVGHTLVLDVVNPGNVEARVNFDVFNQDGTVSPSIPETVIAAGERKEISLAGIAPESSSLAIQVTSTGAEVSAYLHETITQTLEPAGSDIVGPSALPSTEQVLPGMFVHERAEADEASPTNLGSMVRIVNPNDTEAQAVLEISDLSGETVEQIDLPLRPNTVIDYPITTLPNGTYSLRLSSDLPVAMSGRVAPMQPDEFGWQPSSPQLSDEVIAAVPDGPNATLTLTNTGDDARTVTIDGDEVEIAAHASHALESSGEIEILGAEGLYAAVNYSTGGQIASFPVQPGNADAEPVEVVR